MENEKGLLCSVYKNPLGDCSNNGVSSRFKSVILIDEKIDRVFEANENLPPVKLVRRMLFGREYLHVEPIGKQYKDKWFMSGGSFIYSCDSRFRTVSNYPIPFHDRVEE